LLLYLSEVSDIEFGYWGTSFKFAFTNRQWSIRSVRSGIVVTRSVPHVSVKLSIIAINMG
jgi:hypothetical protein